MECLYAAVNCGADAVYFAGKMFGARSYADNFLDDEIKEAVRYCHLRGVRAYVTVNTLIPDREISELMEYLLMLSNIGTDAVIVQDLGLAALIRENFPDLPVHGSTQITVHNAEGVRELEKMGIEQVVLSRELSIGEIEEIKKETTARLEVFAHGALCMCYSGQCYFSSVLGGRSGNRGKCAQPCRLEYKINDYPQKGFYMSLKDLCLLRHINRLKDAGVSSLKIEGRMKGAEYVAAVVGMYRKYIDSEKEPTKEDIAALDSIFFRGGLTDGYLTGKSGREMFCFDKPDNPYERQSKTGVEIPDSARKIRLFCRAEFTEGCYPEIEISDGEISVSHRGGEIIPKSENRALSEEFVIEKLGKTGGTPYEFEDITVKISGEPFMSAGGINGLRREVLKKYEDKIVSSYERNGSYEIQNVPSKPKSAAKFVCRVASEEQFDAVCGYDFARIHLPLNIIIGNQDKFLQYKDKIVIEPGAIVKDSGEVLAKLKSLRKPGFSKLSAENIWLAGADDFEIYGGFRLNVMNSQTLRYLKEQGFKSAALSPELNLAQIRDLKKPIETEVMVYGRIPLMVTENCVIKNREKCPCNREVNYLTDRKGVSFPVVRDCGECRSIILNSLPTFMGDKIGEVKGSGAESLMLYFTIESGEETKKVCRMFFEGKGKPDTYTRLHYYKGVL